MGRDDLMEPDAAGWAPQVLRDYFEPDALDSVYQDLDRFSRSKGATRAMDEHPTKFGL